MPRRYYLRETAPAQTVEPNKSAASGARSAPDKPTPQRPLETWRVMLIVLRALKSFTEARKAVLEAWRAADSPRNENAVFAERTREPVENKANDVSIHVHQHEPA